MKFNKEQLQAIINDKSAKWGISEKTLASALKEIGEFQADSNKENVKAIYSKSVLRKYLRTLHKEERQNYVKTGDFKYLKKVYEVFPVGNNGKQDISELMTWGRALKDPRVRWSTVANRQTTGATRSAKAVESMLAFADLARSLSN